MKKISRALIVVMILLFASGSCFASYTYPEYSSANKGETAVTERINIVFDNSGHDNVKKMMTDIIKAAAVAENSAIWIYPIAGSAEPIQVASGKDFAENHYIAYAKSSNEFKQENVVEKAREDLLNDTSVEKKRLILYADHTTAQIRSEYELQKAFEPYITDTPGVIFSVFYSYGNMLGSHYIKGANDNNYEYLSNTGTGLFDFLLVKNGYSLCDSVYNKEQGVLKLEKGKADNNIFVFATNSAHITFSNTTGELYLGGCMMGTEAYENYQKSKKVTGVALSYNHTLIEAEQSDKTLAFAMYTADGTTVDPLNDDVYIPVVNAEEVVVYNRSTKGAGICSPETTYNTTQDKKIVNASAPVENEENISANEIEINTGLNAPVTNDENQSVLQKILSVIGKIIATIFRLLFMIIRILIFAFIILLIVSRKFRSYIQLKILNTKFGPLYEKIIIKVKKIITDIAGAGAKIKGNADLKGDYIFISKASADMGLPNNRISLLIRELERRGIPCWLSETGIKAGEDYNVVLPQAIKSCTLFLLFVSPMSVKSSDVVSEIGTAKEHKKNIIPVQIEPFDLFKDFPNWAYMLKQYQKTDLFSSKEAEIKSLADQIESAYNSLKK